MVETSDKKILTFYMTKKIETNKLKKSKKTAL